MSLRSGIPVKPHSPSSAQHARKACNSLPDAARINGTKTDCVTDRKSQHGRSILMLLGSLLLLSGTGFTALLTGGCSSVNSNCVTISGNALQSDGSPLDRGIDTSIPVRSDVSVIGFHTSTSELETIRLRAEAAEEKILESVEGILREAQKPWPYGDVGEHFGLMSTGKGQFEQHCVRLDHRCAKTVLTDASQRLYARVLAYLMTFDARYAEEARSILLSFSRSSGFGEINGVADTSGTNQCALEVSLLMPLLIESAMLLDTYPGWSADDRASVQQWLAVEIYPVTSALARTRKNNWGNSGAFASWAIAHYLLDTDLVLQDHIQPDEQLSPADAKVAHVQTQLDIVGNSWRGDSQCDEFGVQNHGGIPDELRRGSSGCDATSIAEKDLSYHYQQHASAILIFHAQAMQRLGNNQLYEKRLPNGERLVLQTVLFVIDNTDGNSYNWRSGSIGALRVLNDYYFDPRICDQLDQSDLFTEGSYLPYTKLTYPDVCR